MPGCGARVPRREQRTRTGRSVPGSRSEPTRGSRRLGARLGSGPGRRGSRRQRGCRRGDAAAGWGCERQAERCPPAPAAAPPPPCWPRRKPPAPRGGASEPGLRGSGPARPAPAQPEVSAAARSRPSAPLAPASPLRPRPSPRRRSPCPGAGGRPRTTPPIPVGAGGGYGAGWGPPEPPGPPLGWPLAALPGAWGWKGPRVSRLPVPDCAGCRLGAGRRVRGAGGC